MTSWFFLKLVIKTFWIVSESLKLVKSFESCGNSKENCMKMVHCSIFLLKLYQNHLKLLLIAVVICYILLANLYRNSINDLKSPCEEFFSGVTIECMKLWRQRQLNVALQKVYKTNLINRIYRHIALKHFNFIWTVNYHPTLESCFNTVCNSNGW